MSGGGDSASTTTAAASSMTALAEQMRVAAEHEWLNQRVQVFWSANGAVTKRRGTVLAIRWLDSAALGAKDAKEFETLAIRSLAASVRFDDDEHAVFDGELVADLTHCLEEDDEENEFEEQQSASFATAELWNVHALFGVCKSAQNTLATDATVVNGNSDELFHSAAESKRASHAGSVLPSLVAELLTARSVSDAAAAVDPAAARLPLPDVLLADVYAALDGALADSFVASHRGELQQLLELSSTLLAEAPMLRDESWSLRAFVGAAAVGPTSLPLVRQGLQAACIVLRVALLRDSPPLSEEAFETSIRLARAVLTNGIAPLFDSSLEVLAKQNSKLGLAGADSSEPRARLSQLARAGATLISQVLVLLAHLVSHAAALVAQRHTGDVLLLSLTSLAQTALLIDPSSRALPGLELLQLAAISVFRTVFRRHPAHRTAILDDVLLALGRLPKTTKKSARTFRVVVSPPGRARTVETIHMTSALIVQLIQSCAAVPPLIEVKPAADEPSPPPPPAKRDKRVKQVRKATAKNAANDAAAAAIAAEFEAATSTASTATQAAPPDSAETPAQMARYFLATLVSRSAMPNKQERDEAGYKNVFDNLLQDLLLLWPLIEWPGAETALAVLVRVLLRGLSPLDGADDVSPQLRDMALSTLGSIATRVELVSGQVGALSLGHCGLACPCGDATKAVVNMACAACNAVFHVTCLAPDRVGDGVDAKRWRCDACLARAAVGALLTTVAPPPPPPSQPPPVVVAKPTKAKGRSKRTAAAAEVEPVAAETPVAAASAAAVAPDALDDELVATQVAFDWLNALVAAARDNGDAADALIDAEKAHVSRWLARFEALGRPLGAALMRHDYEHGLGAKPSALLLSESESQRVAAQVLVHSGALVSLFPLMLRALLVLLADKSKASRARALKALVGIVDANPRLLLEPSTRRAISDRCLDTATSVRDAALELIGKYLVLGDNELIEQFLPVTLERARDTGVSVRKRVVQILRDLCVRVPGHPRVSQICRVLVLRIGDVPSVSSAILRTFEQLWFAPLTAAHGATLEQRCDQLTAVCAGAPATSDWLVDLLRRLLDAPDGAAVQSLCAQLVALLARRVVEFDEARSQAAADEGANQQFVNVLAALVVFARVRASLLVPHIVALAHYLQVPSARVDPSDARAVATRRTDIAAALRATALFEECAPLLGECNADLVARVEAQLSALISSQGLALVEAAVACLGKVVTHVSHNRATMVDLLGKCSKFVEARTPARGKLEQRDAPMLLRCLCVIGLLVQHYDFDNDVAAVDVGDEAAKKAAEARGDRSVDDAFALLSEFVVNCEENVRVRAVRSLCAVTTRRPTLLARGVFAWLLRTDEPSAQVTAAMLEGLHELLRLQQLSYATPLEPLPAVDDARGSEEDDENGAAAAAAADVDGDADVDDKPLKASSSFVSMHDSSDTSFVATQMQLAMPKVLPHFNHASDEVRLQALKLGTMATRMGIVNPLVCVPSTLALLGDANADLSKPALALITFLHNKHANLLHSRLVDGVRFAYQQLRARLVAARPPRLTKREATLAGAVRAINTVTHEANFGRVFELLDSNRRQREAFVVGCATQLEANSQLGRVDAPYVAFLCELLASLHYRSVHEPIEVVYIAHRVVSLHGSGVVRLCEQQLAHADAATQARNVCDAAAALSLLIYLKRFLKRVWHLTADALRDHVPLSATAQRVKAVPVRRFEGELISSAGGFGDVILESGGDLARMRAQFETLQQLMENELDDQFDVKGEDDEAPPTSKQATPNGGATQRKRGRPPKGATAAAARKKRSRASKADDSEDDEGQEPLLSDD